MRFRCVIEYDGTDFVGWQRQPNGRSVQGEIEDVILRQFGRRIAVHGAGRTDSGVHAAGQVAHFDLDVDLQPAQLAKALNAGLPDDITILAAEHASADFHSRYSASARSYVYTIRRRRTSLSRRSSYTVFAPLDVPAIRAILPQLVGMHDYSAFSKHNDGQHNHRCYVFCAEWLEDPEGYRFRIKANRFLTGMVRALVGGLLMVGRGKWSPQDFLDTLASHDRNRIPMLVPARGLVLESVSYDAEEFAFIREQIRLHAGRAAADVHPSTPQHGDE